MIYLLVAVCALIFFGFFYLMYVASKQGGKEISLGKSKAKQLNDSNGDCCCGADCCCGVTDCDCDEKCECECKDCDCKWKCDCESLPALTKKQLEEAEKVGPRNGAEARMIAINKAFLSGNAVYGNMGPDGEWTFEEIKMDKK